MEKTINKYLEMLKKQTLTKNRKIELSNKWVFTTKKTYSNNITFGILWNEKEEIYNKGLYDVFCCWKVVLSCIVFII